MVPEKNPLRFTALAVVTPQSAKLVIAAFTIQVEAAALSAGAGIPAECDQARRPVPRFKVTASDRKHILLRIAASATGHCSALPPQPPSGALSEFGCGFDSALKHKCVHEVTEVVVREPAEDDWVVSFLLHPRDMVADGSCMLLQALAFQLEYEAEERHEESKILREQVLPEALLYGAIEENVAALEMYLEAWKQQRQRLQPGQITKSLCKGRRSHWSLTTRVSCQSLLLDLISSGIGGRRKLRALSIP
eukprot:s923_g20.t1